jgi:hypothetical protein
MPCFIVEKFRRLMGLGKMRSKMTGHSLASNIEGRIRIVQQIFDNLAGYVTRSTELLRANHEPFRIRCGQ